MFVRKVVLNNKLRYTFTDKNSLWTSFSENHAQIQLEQFKNARGYCMKDVHGIFKPPPSPSQYCFHMDKHNKQYAREAANIFFLQYNTHWVDKGDIDLYIYLVPTSFIIKIIARQIISSNDMSHINT